MGVFQWWVSRKDRQRLTSAKLSPFSLFGSAFNMAADVDEDDKLSADSSADDFTHPGLQAPTAVLYVQITQQ